VSSFTSPNRVLPDSSRLVRETIAGADRQRRSRDASRQLWRVAPLVGATGLCAAIASRWGGWSAIVPLSVLALGAVALCGFAVTSRRARDISDSAAAGLDDDAGFGGELRSASWFAAHESGSEWAEFHLARAAARLQATDWAHLYPVSRARRARIATAIMGVGAIALLLVASPGRGSLFARGSTNKEPAGATPRTPVLQTDMLPPTLPKDLEELLRAAEAGLAPPSSNAAGAARLQELLAQLGALHDPKALKALAEAMAPGSSLTPAELAEKLKALADRTKRAADMSLTQPEVRDALKELSKELSIAADAEQAKSGEDPREASASKDSSQGESGKAEAGKDAPDASLQFSKDAGAGSGIGVLMTSSDAAPSGDVLPGVGLGGSSGDRPGGGTMADLERALRKETVEASTDSAGDNVVTTGARRKTEQAKAGVTFSRGAGTLDQGRAAAPPRVPEARRTGVQTYFVRRP
jgi:hypothetical protein